ncbi:MAG TPA: hypothetical protein VMV81_13100 [Phycisphaerae bacterium]|nr:hypothetical protein [Phycisphaerae bacterium]
MKHPPFQSAGRLCVAASCTIVIFISGCTGHGRIDFVSLNMSEIDPPQAMPWTFQAQECYWWVDQNGELNIAMRHRQRNPILGKVANVDLVTSFVFEGPPAGTGRNYRVTPRDIRAIYASPLATQRFNATSGIVGVTVGKDNVLRGSFRVWMMPLVEVSLFSFLPQRPGSVLSYGTFQAVRNEKAGVPLRDFSEANGFVRPKKAATSQPATKTAKLAAIVQDCGSFGDR